MTETKTAKKDESMFETKTLDLKICQVLREIQLHL